MDRERRDVYPDDVRRDLAAHRVEVAWAGLSREAVFRGAPAHDVTVTMEHHYFDWIDDHSARPEHFFLSPRGEGLVRCRWPLDPSWDLERCRLYRLRSAALQLDVVGGGDRSRLLERSRPTRDGAERQHR